MQGIVTATKDLQPCSEHCHCHERSSALECFCSMTDLQPHRNCCCCCENATARQGMLPCDVDACCLCVVVAFGRPWLSTHNHSACHGRCKHCEIKRNPSFYGGLGSWGQSVFWAWLVDWLCVDLGVSVKRVGSGDSSMVERQTRDRDIAGSSTDVSGGRSLLQGQILCPYQPCVTAVARKRSRSFCQICTRRRITAKHNAPYLSAFAGRDTVN